MRAIIIAASRPAGNTTNRWGGLAPLLDRSFLQHIIEYVMDEGVKEIDFLLAKEFEGVRELLGKGTRWGGTFRYHLVGNGACLLDLLRPFRDKNFEFKILLAHADRLPSVQIHKIVQTPGSSSLCSRENGRLIWTGWAILNAADLAGIPQSIDEEHLYRFLQLVSRVVEVGPPLMAQSYADVIESNRRALAGEHPGLPRLGKEVQPNLWIERNVRIHRTAKLFPPAYLGENCRVAAMAQVGPSAVIGKDCLIDRDTLISNSVICQGTFVGEGLALNSVVVNQSTLIDTRLGVEIDDVDELLLCSVFGTSWKAKVLLACESALAALLFVLALPLLVIALLASGLGCGPRLHRRKFVRTPTVPEPSRWHTSDLWSFGNDSTLGWKRYLLYRFLPALPQVALGRLALSGPPPLCAEELMALPASSRLNRLGVRGGVLRRSKSTTSK